MPLAVAVALRRCALAAGLWMLSLAACAQAIGLVFDHALDPARDRRAALWNARLLRTLDHHQVHAMVFPAWRRGGTSAASLALLEPWAQGGHVVGSLGERERSLPSTQATPTAWRAAAQRNTEALQHLRLWQPLLRAVPLQDADTREARDPVREGLREHGSRTVPVSIDNADGYYNERYLALRNAGRSADAKRLLRLYVRHLQQRAAAYDLMSRRVLGRSPQHLMRLHANAINAAALGDVIEAFRGKGWHFMSARAALDDPLYAMQPELAPGGQSIVWALARARGVDDLRQPAEGAAYERPGLKRVGLAP